MKIAAILAVALLLIGCSGNGASAIDPRTIDLVEQKYLETLPDYTVIAKHEYGVESIHRDFPGRYVTVAVDGRRSDLGVGERCFAAAVIGAVLPETLPETAADRVAREDKKAIYRAVFKREPPPDFAPPFIERCRSGLRY